MSKDLRYNKDDPIDSMTDDFSLFIENGKTTRYRQEKDRSKYKQNSLRRARKGRHSFEQENTHQPVQ